MEALLVLLVLALLVMQAIVLGRVSGITREMEWLRRQLSDRLTPVQKPTTPLPPAPPQPIQAPSVPAAPASKAPPPGAEDAVARMREVFPDAAAAPPPFLPPPVVEVPRPRPSPPPQRPGFFERHPDLEKFIGENLINKIGIAVLVIGIGLLLRYAIGKNLISETGRALIGLGAGGLLIFFAHRLRNGFRPFSSVLAAGGIAVFYSTITIAFHEYHLIGQTAAFAIMVVVTGLSVLLTLAYDRKELAVISLLGGFAAPFLVSTGDGNYLVLFTYLLILDAGMLVLANFKKWHIINVLSFALTTLVVGVWAMDPYTDLDPRPVLPAFAFATGFFLVFFTMNLRFNLRHRHAFVAIDHILLLVNTAVYFGLGLHFLSDLTVRVTGLFTVLLGLFYLLFALYFHKREGIPAPLKLLLIGLVLTFISLAAPVQLEGSRITLFWAAEAVLLLWFSQRTGLRLVERASVLVTALMLVSLCMDLEDVYGWAAEANMRPLLNKGWITGMVVTASLALTHGLLRKVDGAAAILLGLTRTAWRTLALIGALVVLYAINLLEQHYQLGRVLHHSVVHQALIAYTLLFVLAVSWFMRNAHGAIRTGSLVLLLVCGLVFITGTYSESRLALRLADRAGQDIGFLPLHLLAVALMVLAVVRVAVLARKRLLRPSSSWSAYLWSASIYIVILASQELDIAMILVRGTVVGLDDARRVGYPILWGIGSFMFMWHGMRQRLRAVRVIALCLFAITLLKLFLLDLGALSEGGRVAAFIFLGALLLVISFMYNKLKGLFVDDAPKPEAHDATKTN